MICDAHVNCRNIAYVHDVSGVVEEGGDPSGSTPSPLPRDPDLCRDNLSLQGDWVLSGSTPYPSNVGSGKGETTRVEPARESNRQEQQQQQVPMDPGDTIRPCRLQLSLWAYFLCWLIGCSIPLLLSPLLIILLKPLSICPPLCSSSSFSRSLQLLGSSSRCLPYSLHPPRSFACY